MTHGLFFSIASRSPATRIAAGLAASVTLLASCSPVQQLRNVASAGGSLANSLAATGEAAALGAPDLRDLQSRNLEGTKSAAFASVMSVLLDSGYRVTSADLTSGLITAAGSTSERLRLDVSGVAKAAETPMASVYVEEIQPGSVRVRANFSVARSGTGVLTSSGERPVLEASVYASFFERLQGEILQRPGAVEQLAAPAPGPVLTAPPPPAPEPESTEEAGEPASEDSAEAESAEEELFIVEPAPATEPSSFEIP